MCRRADEEVQAHPNASAFRWIENRDRAGSFGKIVLKNNMKVGGKLMNK